MLWDFVFECFTQVILSILENEVPQGYFRRRGCKKTKREPQGSKMVPLGIPRDSRELPERSKSLGRPKAVLKRPKGAQEPHIAL